MNGAAARSWDWFAPDPEQDLALLEQLPFLPGLPELLMLRQVHALEHGTVWVLSEGEDNGDNPSLGGLSTDRGFFLYGKVERSRLHEAVRRALQRFQAGEWDLAVHPRCGTNISVALLLSAGLAVGTHFLFPRDPIGQLLGVGAAIATADRIAPDLGLLAQKYVTTAIPFNLELVGIAQTKDLWGRPAQFVRLQWRGLK